ncbi:MAG TPA: patatin-like phospholipase family protein, partial [Vicinamibacterales bacterium]
MAVLDFGVSDSGVAPALLALTEFDWSIFRDLEDIDEPHRRLILRSHREMPFEPTHARAVSGYRARLDQALDRVMLRELGLETGLLTDVQALAGIPHLGALFGSSAFVRYVDARLGLSLRFVAERLGISDPERKEVNELPVARPCPPPLLAAHTADALPAMDLLLELESALDADDDVVAAMRFLDGFLADRTEHAQAHYELWLRRLNGTSDDDARFNQITRGLIKFAAFKTEFYCNLEGVERIAAWQRDPVPGTWSARHPITARIGVYDLYRVARLLRAEVSPTGEVTYADGSWLKLLATRGPELVPASASGLATWDEVLHGVLDYACDLIQNSADIASDRVEARESATPIVRPQTTVSWRTMYDEELAEVTRQRQERQYDHVKPLSAVEPTDAVQSRAPGDRTRKTDETPEPSARDFRLTPTWSRRLCTGEHVDDLVGLALSGGGIRSATFGLGVLQRLQEIQLLRQVDYLSTVSGGGYIGAWLVASVRRTRYWLTQPTDWERSIDHLRRYSNYLSPRRGLMSADTWTMWGSWIRNALLIQSSALVWLAWVMLIVGLGKIAFEPPVTPTTLAAVINAYKLIVSVALVVLAALIYKNLGSEKAGIRDRWVLYLMVLPAWAGSFFASAVLWLTRPLSSPPFSEVLVLGLREWLVPLLLFIVSVGALAWRSSTGRLVLRTLLATLAAACSATVTYLAVCGIFWLYGQWSREAPHYVWYAYSLGPSLMLLSVTAGVLTMIGVLGHSSPDWRREWWTRLGSWLGIYGVVFLAASLGTILGPWATLKAVDASHSRTIPWGTVLAWIGTVVGGLFAGNRARPEAEPADDLKAKALAVFARFAALAFIVGSVLVVATLVHVLLAKIWSCTNLLYTQHCYEVTADNYWHNLSAVRPVEYALSAALVLVLGIICSTRFELNVFGLNQFYRNRLVRCYLGATRWVPGLRTPHPFTAFDGGDDLPL